MPNYSAPGVYVEEVSSGIKPIAGVGTSTAGFIGVVAGNVKMPDQPGKFKSNGSGAPVRDEDGKLIPQPYPVADPGEPQLVTSWDGFKSRFGDFQAGNLLLAHAVYGFFNNGGTRCWVVRVAGGDAQQPAQPAAAAAERASGSGRAKQEKARDEGADAPALAASTAVAVLTLPKEEQIKANRLAVPEALIAIRNVSTAALTEALAALKAIDEVAIVAIPGAVADTAQNAIIDHCENEYLQDRFAILDGQPVTTLTKDAIQGNTRDSQYAALYFPWIKVYDPFSDSAITVPPSGHIAGVYARTDGDRGVHKAPANAVIRGAVGVEKILSKQDQAGLNPDGINVIRKFDGNITVWGARTLSNDTEWTYINVRRLFLFLRESIDEGTQWVVFEPNTPQLWAKIRRNITAFLTNVWSSGALFGNTPAEAFYVRCDESTNPPEVRELGQVVTEIGVAVVRPAEFVIFRISQWAGPGQ